jgi:hypothetical protein
MKIMNVSLNIDVANVKHVEALERLMRTLGDLPMVEKIIEEHNPSIDIRIQEELKPKRVRKQKAAPAPEPEPEVEDEDEDEEEDLVGAEEEQEIDVATLRTLTAGKSANHRKAIKAKLAEYEVENVTSIPKEKYKDYYQFITSL